MGVRGFCVSGCRLCDMKIDGIVMSGITSKMMMSWVVFFG
jgi:hypothetical protein